MKSKFLKHQPQLAANVFFADGAQIIGQVSIASNSSIWFNAVLRGDVAPIIIGSNTNIQDNSTLHGDKDYDLVIGNNVTVGHSVVLHGCTVKNSCLIGMGAIILNGAKIGEESLIGANTLITPQQEIPPRSLVMGSPGKVIRPLKTAEIDEIKASAQRYVDLKNIYLAQK